MGLCCMTQIDKCETYLDNHPFININESNMQTVVESALQNLELIKQKKNEALDWVKENHSYDKVIDKLYNLYQESGVI